MLMDMKDIKMVKEVDFGSDIDVDKSLYFNFNKQKQRLEFICEEKERYTLSDYKMYFGKVEQSGSDINLIPEVNEKFGDLSYGSASLLLGKPLFDHDKDMAAVKFEYNEDAHIYIRLFNKKLYDLTRKVIDKESGYESASFNDPDNKSTDIILADNHLTIQKRTGTKIDFEDSVSYPLSNCSVDMIINNKDHYILVNGKKYRSPVLSLIGNEEVYLSILAFEKKEKCTGSIAHINKIMCGKSEGYLYFKPFAFNYKQLKVIMMYRGNPCLQYLPDNSNKWLDISVDQTVSVESQLVMRVKACTKDHIYKIIFAESR